MVCHLNHSQVLLEFKYHGPYKPNVAIYNIQNKPVEWSLFMTLL